MRTRASLVRWALAGVGLAMVLGCGRVATLAPAGQKTAGMAAQARQAGPGWYAVQLHCHSAYSDGNMGVKALIAEAKQAGLDALALSDHDTTSQWLDPDFVAEKELVMMRSQECGDPHGGNHLGVHGFSGITPIRSTADREDSLAEAARRGGTLIINHPSNNMYPWLPATLDRRAHAVEVWNSFFWSPMLDQSEADKSWRPNEEAITWWAENLAAGARVAAVAAADFHRKPQAVGSPCTLIYAEARTQDAILAGLRAGRTVLVTTPRSERLELTADGDGDGRFETMVGGEVPASAKLRLRVTGAKGEVLLLMRGKRAVWKATVPGQDWATELALPAGEAPFVYARLNGSALPAATARAMTSAIYVR